MSNTCTCIGKIERQGKYLQCKLHRNLGEYRIRHFYNIIVRIYFSEKRTGLPLKNIHQKMYCALKIGYATTDRSGACYFIQYLFFYYAITATIFNGLHARIE